MITEMPILEYWVDDLLKITTGKDVVVGEDTALRLTLNGKRISVEVRLKGECCAIGSMWRDMRRDETVYLLFDRGDDAILYTTVFTYVTRNLVL